MSLNAGAAKARGGLLDGRVAVSFASQLREARQNALRDSEAFDEIIQVVERLGSFLYGNAAGLGRYKEKIEEVASVSPLAESVTRQHRDVHTPFSLLYELVREGRNDAMHQGAVARRLTRHAIELSLILEDALLRTLDSLVVGDYMVRNPICAEMWQPISHIRQQMLTSSFSFLPVRSDSGWCLVSDIEIASYLGTEQSERGTRLNQSLSDAALPRRNARFCPVGAPLEQALGMLIEDQSPILVSQGEGVEYKTPIGIVTAFDLL